jgi:Zn-dependent membrane protease YugP
MSYLFFIALILGASFGPQIWVSFIMKRYSLSDTDIPGTGAELAEHLLSQYQMDSYRIEETDLPDHFNPENRTIYLSRTIYHSRSLTAVAIAAHEFSHALQHFKSPATLKFRTWIAQKAVKAEKAGAIALLILPIVGALSRIPGVFAATVLLAFAGMFMGVLTQLITLPVEWDASFNKALPILKEGGYIQPHQEAAVAKILKAAALTYLASALRDVFRFGKLFRIIRK